MRVRFHSTSGPTLTIERWFGGIEFHSGKTRVSVVQQPEGSVKVIAGNGKHRQEFVVDAASAGATGQPLLDTALATALNRNDKMSQMLLDLDAFIQAEPALCFQSPSVKLGTKPGFARCMLHIGASSLLSAGGIIICAGSIGLGCAMSGASAYFAWDATATACHFQ